VSLFSLSLWALVFGLANLDARQIGAGFRPGTPVKWISGYMFLWGIILGTAWLTQAVIFVVTGHLPPSFLG